MIDFIEKVQLAPSSRGQKWQSGKVVGNFGLIPYSRGVYNLSRLMHNCFELLLENQIVI